MKNQPPFRHVLIFGLLLALIGWGGLAYCLFFTLPTLGPRWFFFFFLTLAVCGVVLPVLSFLHRRFPMNPPADGNVVVRQALWFGIYFGLVAWLQLGRALSSNRTIFLAVGFIVMEMLLRLLETSRWKPGSVDDRQVNTPEGYREIPRKKAPRNDDRVRQRPQRNIEEDEDK